MRVHRFAGQLGLNSDVAGGDRIGALFAGNTALAILSGGNFCPGGTSNAAFFMPVIPDLDYWGVWLIGGP